MKKKDLYERLESALATYTILDVDAERPFGWDLTKDRQSAGEPGKDEHKDAGQNRHTSKGKKTSHGSASSNAAVRQMPYDIQRDRRFTNWIKEMGGSGKSAVSRKSSGSKPSPEGKKDAMFLGAISRMVVSGLSKYSLHIPSAKEMDALLSIVGVTPTEMNIFSGMLRESDLTSLGGAAVRPLALLFHRVLWDALCESCGVEGWTKPQDAAGDKGRNKGGKHGRPDKRAKSNSPAGGDKRVCWDKLEEFVDYLLKNDLLELDCLHICRPQEEEESASVSEQDGEQEQQGGQTRLEQGKDVDFAYAASVQEAMEEYDSFFFRCALLECKRVIAFEEMKETKEKTDRETERIAKQAEKLMYQEIRKSARKKPAGQTGANPSGKAAPRPPFLQEVPCNLPFADPTSGNFASARQITSPGSPRIPGFPFQAPFLDVLGMAEALMDAGKDEEAAYLLDREFCSKPRVSGVLALRKRVREVFTAVDNYFCAVRERCVSAVNQIVREQAELLTDEIGVDIAECTLVAMLNGDECYKLEISNLVFPYLGRLLGVPGTEPMLPELQDEEEWNDLLWPEDNGKLALAIVKEDEVAVYGTEEESPVLLRTARLDGAIADFAGCQFNDGLFIRKSHVAAFREMGYSARRSRDFAIVAATLRYAVEHEEITDVRLFGEGKSERVEKQEGTPDSVTSENGPQPESGADDLQLLTMERDEAKKRHKAAERECQKLRHDVAEGNRALEKLIPGLRIVEVASRIDTTAFRSADIIFLQINKTNHSNYWSVCDTAKNAGVPYYHLNFANARRCAEEMVKRIKGLD